MKNTKMIFAAATLILSAGIMSCGEGTEGNQPEMQQVQTYNDSIPAQIPGISTIQTKVDKDETSVSKSIHIKLILGAPRLYDATPQEQQQAAVKAGVTALRVFNTGIDAGTLIVTKDLKEHKEDPADGKRIDMKIDSLKKAMQIK